MLNVEIPKTEYFDERTQRFALTKEYRFTIEHSLVSLAKWEAKWKKPFLATSQKTHEELMDYIKCMTITQNVPDDAYVVLTAHPEILENIKDYMEDPMTATTITDMSGSRSPNRQSSQKIVTAEIIYYWMIQFQIPLDFQKWHLNRLLTLIRVCDIKNTPQKNMPKSQIYEQNRRLNAARRAKLHSKG